MIKIKGDTFDYMPVGSIISIYIPFIDTMPSYWQECDGSTISDSESPLDGTDVPDLNGDNRYLRGNTTSGGTGGTNATHNHTMNTWPDNGGNYGSFVGATLSSLSVGLSSAEPAHQEVKYYMRVK